MKRKAPKSSSTDSLEKKVNQLIQKVREKNKAYGASFTKVPRLIEQMTQDMSPEQVKEALPRIVKTVRLLDKFMRYIWQPEAFGEDPTIDILGYALLLFKEDL